ncbi:MAG: 16S rRNA (guanine(527)-N(7))-methyltransferase RsmG [Cyanobacteria bacterium J06649_4]
MTSALPNHSSLWHSSLQWQPTDKQQEQFQQLYSEILTGNQQLNLTRITDPDEFWEKHLWDSLSGVSPWLLESARANEPMDTDDENAPLKIIDIGTGGGFPGIPAAIAFAPTPLDLTLVDSTRKKILFLQTLCQRLKLPATCLAERAETLGQDRHYRAQYDLALVRAVGSAATCAEYALPFLKVGGQAVLYRGQWTTEDTEVLIPVVDLLGGELTDLQRWETPLSQSHRHCLFIYKERPTPNEFPRAVGVPNKSPLT